MSLFRTNFNQIKPSFGEALALAPLARALAGKKYPKHWWVMVEGGGVTAHDFGRGNQSNGTLTLMDPATDWILGKYGMGLDLDGSDDEVLCTPSGNASTNRVTVASRFKLDTIGNFESPIFTRGGPLALGLYVQNSLHGEASYSWENTADEWNANSSLVTPTGEWVTLAVVISPTAANLYMLKQDSTFSSFTNTKTHNAKDIDILWELGRDSGGGFMDGVLDYCLLDTGHIWTSEEVLTFARNPWASFEEAARYINSMYQVKAPVVAAGRIMSSLTQHGGLAGAGGIAGHGGGLAG